MNKIFNISSTLLLTAILLLTAACSSDSSNDVQPSPTPNNQKEISIQTGVRKMAEGTRAATIDDISALQEQELKIDAYYHDTETKYLDGAKLHYDASAWKFWNSSQVHYYWPIAGSVYTGVEPNITVSSLDFVGFCPYDKPTYIGPPTYNHSTGISFTCDLSSYMTLASQVSMPEYLVAVLNEQTYATQTAAVGGALPLQFKHPFALIKFVITAASGTNVKINSISIDDLYTGATCAYNGSAMSWGTYTGNATMTITETLKNGGTTEGTPFMVIPNNYSTKTLTVNATWDDWSNVTTNVTADVAFNWQAGYIYTYNLTLEKYALKVETTSTYTEQW